MDQGAIGHMGPRGPEVGPAKNINVFCKWPRGRPQGIESRVDGSQGVKGLGVDLKP